MSYVGHREEKKVYTFNERRWRRDKSIKSNTNTTYGNGIIHCCVYIAGSVLDTKKNNVYPKKRWLNKNTSRLMWKLCIFNI